MLLFVIFVKSTVGIFIDVLQFMMFARAIVSWIPGLDDTRLGDFLFTVTEWVITPVRSLFDSLGFNVPMMFDIPFLVTYILLTILGALL